MEFGPNNVGKSNLIRALSFCANMISAGISETTGFLSEVQRNGYSEIYIIQNRIMVF